MKVKQFLFALFTVSTTVLYAETEIVDGIEWKYKVVNGEAMVGVAFESGFYEPSIPESTSGAIVIPSMLGGYPVTSIGCDAFYGCSSLTSISIPEGVTNIGMNAFEGCWSLTTISIPESVTSIGWEAFRFCSSLGSIKIPGSVKTVECSLFYECDSLTNVIVSEGVTSIQHLVFFGCESLTTISIPESVTNIGWGTFAGCRSLTGINIPENITCIESDTFSGCRLLTDINIPESVTSIGEKAFNGCISLTNIFIHGEIKSFGDGIYSGCPASLITHISSKWTGPTTTWNDRRVVMDIGNVSEPIYPPVVTNVVHMTVTNVVIHYVQAGEKTDMAVPITPETGFVTVITEIKGGNVPVPSTWAENYPRFAEMYGSDFGSALTKKSGKVNAAGKELFVWEDYVAGTDPTKKEDVFKASITLVDGTPVVSYTPELSDEEKSRRMYTVFGKERLQDTEWSVVDGDTSLFNFFKVTVEMK